MILQVDEDTGEVMVDIRNTELYLKVISQIHAVYRTDGSRMMFGNSLNALNGSVGSSGGGAGGAPAAPAGPCSK